jgi:PAS domain S-box-containing protein
VRWIVSVVFVALTVVALAIVPYLLGQRMSREQAKTAEMLEPARLLSLELALLQARQLGRFQSFLLTGDHTYRAPYLETLVQEDTIYSRLTRLGRAMEMEIQEEVAHLSSAAQRWHLGHRSAFEADSLREKLLDDLDLDASRYRELQEATLELQESIQSEVDEGRRRVAEVRDLQVRTTWGLMLLALGATCIVALVGLHLRSLTVESEARRRDAVRARRENDALLEATGDGVLGIDLEGRCMALNGAGSALLGYTEREIRGRDVHETLHHTRADGSPRPREGSPILAALGAGGAASAADDLLWRKDGSSFPARWTLQPMLDGLEIRGAVLTITDTTEIRETEAALRRAVHARDEVVSIVSHDLKNPLGVVSGAADILLDLPLDPEERDRQLRIIRRSAERMGRLIRDLLDVARLDAGALIVRRAAEPVRPLLEELHQEFLPQARRKDISLELVVEPELPPGSIDADRIHQALGNLLANALKFTPGGGRIVLGAALDPEGAELVLRVSDTGPGVPEESADLLFDRFWQASRDDRTGAGLGLAIVRGITEAHGGRVEVASTPGRGATFRLHLPTADPSSPSQEAAASPAGDVAAFMGEGWSGEPADAGGGVRRGE